MYWGLSKCADTNEYPNWYTFNSSFGEESVFQWWDPSNLPCHELSTEEDQQWHVLVSRMWWGRWGMDDHLRQLMNMTRTMLRRHLLGKRSSDLKTFWAYSTSFPGHSLFAESWVKLLLQIQISFCKLNGLLICTVCPTLLHYYQMSYFTLATLLSK